MSLLQAATRNVQKAKLCENNHKLENDGMYFHSSLARVTNNYIFIQSRSEIERENDWFMVYLNHVKPKETCYEAKSSHFHRHNIE